jgi:hypothetical protein
MPEGARAKFERLVRSISLLEQRLNLLQLNLEAQRLENSINRRLNTVQAKQVLGDLFGILC